MKVKIWFATMVLAAICLSGAPAWAQTPTAYVRGILDEVMAIQTNPAYAGEAHEAARGRLIHQIIEKNFDFPLMAQNSLAETYSRIGAGQRREFIEVFSYLFQDSYTRLVLNFLKRENVNYSQERLEGSKARVNTVLVRTNETIPVDYLMHRGKGGWILYDVIVDGVSILENYKTQFARVIRTQSFTVLLEKMKTQQRAVK